MALTPEDVVNKRFQPTKFREGYDQDEVDDFLDEVVVELRRLGQENEDLRQRLIASESRIAELQRSNAPTTGEQAQAPAPQQQLSYPTAQVDVGAGNVESFQVAGAKIDNMTVVVADFFEMLSSAIGAKLDGIVGYNFLRNYKVVIDYPGEKLTLF